MDPTVQTEADLLVEQQHRLCEDLQAELAEAVERSRALEDRCCQLEEQLLRVNEESQLKCLRALEAQRSKSKAWEAAAVATAAKPEQCRVGQLCGDCHISR